MTEPFFKPVICEIGRDYSADMRFRWDAQGGLHDMSSPRPKSGAKELVVPLNDSNPTLGRLEPPHSPSDRRPRIEISFMVDEDRWLCATVTDLQTKKVLMTAEPVVRLM